MAVGFVATFLDVATFDVATFDVATFDVATFDVATLPSVATLPNSSTLRYGLPLLVTVKGKSLRHLYRLAESSRIVTVFIVATL